MAYGSIYYLQDDKDTVPRSASVTGTIETVKKKVIGSGTKFTSEFQAGDYLYVAAKSEVKRITNIASDTEMTLESAFSSDVAAGGTPKLVKRMTARYVEINNIGGGIAVLDGQNMANNTKVVFEKTPWGSSTAFSDLVDPVILDAAPSDCQITIVK